IPATHSASSLLRERPEIWASRIASTFAFTTLAALAVICPRYTALLIPLRSAKIRRRKPSLFVEILAIGTGAFRKRPGRAPRLADAAARHRSKVEWSIPRSRAARQGRWAKSLPQQHSPTRWEPARTPTQIPMQVNRRKLRYFPLIARSGTYRLPRRRRGG